VGFFGLSLAHYAGVWNNGFYKDDTQWMADARDITRSPSLLLRHNPDNKECLVRPLQRLGMAAIYRVAGPRPKPYYICGLALHALAAVLVFALVHTVLARTHDGSAARATAIAAGGALIFLLARNHTVAVTWIAAQSSLLAAVAVLGLSLFVLRTPARFGAGAAFAIVVMGFVVALYSKSTAVSFAFLFPLLAWRRLPRPPARRIAWQTAVLFAIAVAHSVFTKQVMGGVDVAAALSPTGAGSYRLSTNVLHNLAAAVVSSVFLPQEYHAALGGHRGPAWGALVLLAGALISLRWVRDRNAVLLGIAFVIACALPTALFDYDQFADRHITVSRYYYLGMTGVALLCSVWFAAATRARTPHWTLVPVLVVAAVGWAAWQHVVLRHQIKWFYTYCTARQQIVTATHAWASQHVAPGTEMYAINWKEEDAQIRGVGRLYFDDLGVRLDGEQALRDLDIERAAALPRYAVRYNETTKSFNIFAIDGLVAKAAALAPQAASDSGSVTAPRP